MRYGGNIGSAVWLLSSMEFFWETIVQPAFTYIQPHTLVEVGTANGLHTKKILEYCKTHGAVLHAIDPVPDFPVKEWKDLYGDAFQMHTDISLNVLGNIQDADVVLIDGDHNWYTVFHELKILERKATQTGTFPVVFLHDIGWPYGRRDLYYDPERIPPAFKKAAVQKGILPGKGLPVDDGGLNANFWHSVEENNVQNGVLTAVEDFLKQTTLSIEPTFVTGLYGLCILAPKTLLNHNPAFAEYLQSLKLPENLKKHYDKVEHDRVQLMVCSQMHAYFRNDSLTRTNEERFKAEETLELERAHMEKEWTARMEDMAQKIKIAIKLADEKVLEKERDLVHLMQTRSWRWTAWLRKLETSVRRLKIERILSIILGDLRILWTGLGKPFPKLAHRIRYDVLGKLRPVHQTKNADETAQVCVIILCSDPSRSLDKAIESVLTQTVHASDILVVDGTTTKDVSDLASLYAEKNVRCMRGHWEHAGDSRNAGTAATSAPFMVYMTSQTVLHQDYILCGVDCMQNNPAAGICYTDRYAFGLYKNLFKAPETFDWKHFDAINHDGAVTMMRRSALEEAGGWDSGDGPESDRMTWHKILRRGFSAVKGKGLYSYTSPEQL